MRRGVVGKVRGESMGESVRRGVVGKVRGESMGESVV